MNKNRTQHIRQRGYTLIELLLYVSMVGFLLITVVGFYGMVAETRVKSQSINEVEQQGALAIDRIAQTIRNANAVTTPAAGASGSSLTVTVPTGSLSPTIFNLSGTVLQITEGAAAAVPLTNSKVQVTSLTFTNLTRSGTPGIIRISMTVSRTNPNNNNVYEYQKTFTSSAALR